ncbi:MAG: aminoacyl-tRNA hydrolase [Candidatus Falkowbacteria bacterium]
MRIIVGLGNPGEQYAKNRHNLGFMALDALLPEAKWQFSKKFKALIYEANDCIYLKPQTFMNNSGEAVQAIMSYYGLLPKTLGVFSKSDSDLNDVLTVIHDDIDIEIGKWKIAHDSRSGGNNGINSIINHLKTKKFQRIKIGVKNELLRTKIPAEKFVLQNFNSEEKTIIASVLKEALKTL